MNVIVILSEPKNPLLLVTTPTTGDEYDDIEMCESGIEGMLMS